MYELYNEYANLSVEESSTDEGNTSGSNTSSNYVRKSTIVTRFDEIIKYCERERSCPCYEIWNRCLS